MEIPLSAHELSGLLLSQSRLLHYEQLISKSEKVLFRMETYNRIKNSIPNGK